MTRDSSGLGAILRFGVRALTPPNALFGIERIPPISSAPLVQHARFDWTGRSEFECRTAAGRQKMVFFLLIEKRFTYDGRGNRSENSVWIRARKPDFCTVPAGGVFVARDIIRARTVRRRICSGSGFLVARRHRRSSYGTKKIKKYHDNGVNAWDHAIFPRSNSSQSGSCSTGERVSAASVTTTTTIIRRSRVRAKRKNDAGGTLCRMKRLVHVRPRCEQTNTMTRR